ncbi:CLIP domain-containing serine protease HP8-like [Aethina tumida]|uniref:CLIP domain-containing serine protease HP8-like n=1 Tax=Aethina tumida TaxID=116153 RepID=UPI00096AF62F|nr:CLIP domain-containing serine protease HP8-like [Aethina tumida]
MVTTSLFSVLVCCFGLSLFVNGQNYEGCSTPRGRPGNCVVITDCTPLYSILQKRPIASGDADYLRRSQCGFNGHLPKVCCPLEREPSTTPRPAQTTSSGQNENVINSPLLPTKTQCGVDTQNRIFGGESADLDEFPWMVLVEYERPSKVRGFYCGGVLINEKYVLTAAHCVIGKDLPKDWKLISVRLGEYNTDTDIDCIDYKVGNYRDCAPEPQNIAVEERIPHEAYDPYDVNQENDIALLRLVKPAVYSEYVRPICLPTTAAELSKDYTSKNVYVAGWGKTENRSESNIKLKLMVPVRSPQDCTSTYRKANVNLSPQNQICAGGIKGKDSCRGDSGGPLMSLEANEGSINWFSIGVVSFGPTPCGMENWPGVYTNVANYVRWIVGKLRP